MQISVPESPLAWAQGLPYSQAVVAGDLVFCAGVGGFGADGEIVEGGFEAQLRQAFLNIKTALESAGSSLEGVVKLTVFLVDPGDYPGWRTVRSEFMTPPYPAATAVSAALLLPGMLVELEAVGVRGAARA
jgi:2-iminobutanoate/2-iminopropanoate deaminase